MGACMVCHCKPRRTFIPRGHTAPRLERCAAADAVGLGQRQPCHARAGGQGQPAVSTRGVLLCSWNNAARWAPCGRVRRCRGHSSSAVQRHRQHPPGPLCSAAQRMGTSCYRYRSQIWGLFTNQSRFSIDAITQSQRLLASARAEAMQSSRCRRIAWQGPKPCKAADAEGLRGKGRSHAKQQTQKDSVANEGSVEAAVVRTGGIRHRRGHARGSRSSAP